MPVTIYRAVYIYGGSDFSFSKWVTAGGMQGVRDYLATIADVNADENRPRGEDPVIVGWEQIQLEADEPE